MLEINNNIIEKSGILLSRNRPIAFVVGAAGFLGSNLVDRLLEHNIQVLGVDDLSSGTMFNLQRATKNKSLHFINKSITGLQDVSLPRLDYAFFTVSEDTKGDALAGGLRVFLDFIEKHNKGAKEQEIRPASKIVLASNIRLYKRDLDSKLENLKKAEIQFAKYVKDHNLNARIIRFGPLFGPRMHFRESDPAIRLIQASLLDELQGEQTSLDFTTRALYIEDAISLLMKTIFLGSTAHKIYDGILYQPIKVSELKQILLDPLWHESQGFKPTELPPWPTPNSAKTIRELFWRPHTPIVEALKKTIVYFKDNDVDIPNLEDLNVSQKEEKFGLKLDDKRLLEPQPQKNVSKEDGNKRLSLKQGTTRENLKGRAIATRNRIFTITIIAIIFYGLVYPLLSFGLGTYNIKNYIAESKTALEAGDFDQALNKTELAGSWVEKIKQNVEFLNLLKKFGISINRIDDFSQGLDIARQAIEAEKHAIIGVKSLSGATRVISGEDPSDPKKVYQTAKVELTLSSEIISKTRAELAQNNFLNSLPPVLASQIDDLRLKLDFFADFIEKTKVAAILIPNITAVDDKKSYLILLQNNLELRPAGGFIGSYAKVDFENGRIKKISVDDIYNLDGSLKEKIDPPPELKKGLGLDRWFLRDSNFEPDFPTSARQAEFFYNKEAGKRVHGVFALDLSGSAKLIKAVGDLDLADYNEKITQDNLFEKSIAHAEINFFPGSQSKKNFLTSLQTQLFNKLFFSSGQNWPLIVQALMESLEQKHLMIYLAEPTLFSYVVSENWAGVLPRQTPTEAGETTDFLATVDANLGGNKDNYYLERKYRLETTLGKEGQISNHLVITYKNNSPQDVFPGGAYKNHFRIYLPAGTILKKAILGEKEITKDITAFSDYGRSGFMIFFEVQPKEQKSLILDYELKDGLTFKDNKNTYRLDVIKQAGTDKDNFDWIMIYPINLKIDDTKTNYPVSNQELKISTDLLKDRSFMVQFLR